MTNTRPFLFFALCVIGFFLWQAWQQDYVARPAPGSAVPSAPATADAPQKPIADSADVPAAATGAPGVPTPATPTPTSVTETAAQRVAIDTDVLHAVIDVRGGNLVEADLLAY